MMRREWLRDEGFLAPKDREKNWSPVTIIQGRKGPWFLGLVLTLPQITVSAPFTRLPPSAHALHSLHPLHTRRRREWAKRALHVPLGTPYGEWSVRRVNGSRRRGKGSFMKVSINYGLRVGWWWVEDGNLHERALHCYRRVPPVLHPHHLLYPFGMSVVKGGRTGRWRVKGGCNEWKTWGTPWD